MGWWYILEKGKIMQKAQRSKQLGRSGKSEGSGILKLKQPETRLMPGNENKNNTSHSALHTRILRVKTPYEPETILISSLQRGERRPREAE